MATTPPRTAAAMTAHHHAAYAASGRLAKTHHAGWQPGQEQPHHLPFHGHLARLKLPR
jgi:hypothetical protein